ncbi:MAG: homocysteine S-methyltransferase family protein [Oscillospiraceae bacterium]|jgi:5-methyltetrahydrofolate--homocysteine methyltransferase|nr:homocysteine S-methyltransferase family protein [Oscillospiraceae bacterium]
MTFREALTTRILFFDGAMGTALQAQGLRAGEEPENWNVRYPERLIALHGEYLSAGCDVITTNTFGANPLKYNPDKVEETVAAAVNNVKTAIALSRKNARCALDIGPTGRLMEPGGDLAFEDAVAAFAVPIRAGAAAGADLIIIETMTDPYEMKAAILAAKENCSLPIIASFSPDKDGKLLTGGSFGVIANLAEGLGADVLSLNCGFGPDVMAGFARQLAALSSLPLLIMPNAGLPHMHDGETRFDVTPELFAEQMEEIASIAGVCLLGGCCGTTPAHLKQTIARCKSITPTAPTEKHLTSVCSYAKSVTINNSQLTTNNSPVVSGQRPQEDVHGVAGAESNRLGNKTSAPVVIGERINPTGKKLLQAALREGDREYIAGLGISQMHDGADILDVNCGLPGIDEAAAMKKAVRVLQTALSLPLQLDSASPAVLEAGLREYNGIPLVNSVSGKESSLSKVLPLVKKYGGVVVCLTLDENGIPETPAGRLAIAQKIADRALEYGIARHRLLIDPLCMAVSADVDAANITLDSLQLIEKTLGVGTVLGVSNVSFGLPNRDVVSAAFLTRALGLGLDAAIINPGSAAMRTALITHRLLTGQDERCADYIAAAADDQLSYGTGGNAASGQAPKSDEGTLRGAVLRGLEGAAYTLAKKELETTAPNAIINGQLIPVLGEVGEAFAAGTLFLPQLMQSAKAAQEVSRAVKEAMELSGEKQESRGRVALATVEGDVHDIGKNIVRVMLENYGFDVLDLGKNVPAGDVLAAVRREDIRLVGLSALMTTTVPAMAQTVALLKESAPNVRVMVGGAVLTEKAAREMGADGYAADAMGAVEVFGL